MTALATDFAIVRTRAWPEPARAAAVMMVRPARAALKPVLAAQAEPQDMAAVEPGASPGPAAQPEARGPVQVELQARAVRRVGM